MGKQTRATVRHGKDGGGTIHAQTWPQVAPPAKTDSKDKSRQRGHTIQYTADTLVGRLDGRTSNVQGAAQPMHEESHGSRSETLNPDHDIRHCS